MRFMVIVLMSGEVRGAVTRTKKQAFSWRDAVRKNVHDVNIAAWRYHDGSGWADGSEGAWEHVNSLPSHVAVEVYR